MMRIKKYSNFSQPIYEISGLPSGTFEISEGIQKEFWARAVFEVAKDTKTCVRCLREPLKRERVGEIEWIGCEFCGRCVLKDGERVFNRSFAVTNFIIKDARELALGGMIHPSGKVLIVTNGFGSKVGRWGLVVGQAFGPQMKDFWGKIVSSERSVSPTPLENRIKMNSGWGGMILDQPKEWPPLKVNQEFLRELSEETKEDSTEVVRVFTKLQEFLQGMEKIGVGELDVLWSGGYSPTTFMITLKALEKYLPKNTKEWEKIKDSVLERWETKKRWLSS